MSLGFGIISPKKKELMAEKLVVLMEKLALN
jgi:hypothetical protein